MNKSYYYIIFWFISITVFSQDVHWTQWFMAPQLVNPAASGLKYHHLEAGAIYRNQWQNVPVGFNSIVLFGNTDLQKDKIKNITLGASLLHDVAGSSKFTSDQLNVSIGYKKYFLNQTLLISAAIQPNFRTSGFNTSALTFSSNYDGERYNAALNTGENFTSQRFSTIGLGSGITGYYTYKKTNFNFGYARSYDASRNSFALSTTKIKREQRQNITLGSDYQYNKRTQIKFDVAIYFIDQQKEWINALGIRHQPNLKKQEFIGAVLVYRNKDAISLSTNYEKNDWQGFIAYDFNVSKFKVATRYQGGFEIGVKYSYHWPEIIKRKYRQCVIYI